MYFSPRLAKVDPANKPVGDFLNRLEKTDNQKENMVYAFPTTTVSNISLLDDLKGHLLPVISHLDELSSAAPEYKRMDTTDLSADTDAAAQRGST